MRHDVSNQTHPFVRLAICDDFLVVSGWRKVVLSREDITGVVALSGILSAGVELQHRRADEPDVIIWSLHSSTLIAHLQRWLDSP